MKALAFVTITLATAACTADVEILTEDQEATSGASIGTTSRSLSGCNGHASSTIPADGKYVITTFGGGSDTQPMSCGGTANGTGWYAASRQRYGCGSHIKVQANGKCVVLKTDDYGPDVCVENAAHSPIIDVSPAASKALFGVSGAGWSDHLVVTVEEVATTVAVGPCTATPPGGGGGGGGGGTTPPDTGNASCASATLDRDVEDGVCVQSATDSAWYECTNGTWTARSSSAGCTEAYGFCSSATLGRNVPARTCVQAASNSVWYQCNGQNWTTPVSTSTKSGPIGDCATWNPL
ncbi:MAG TPA: hypothetical protein VL326_26560 [Kofleriaceae bacterium]|nr:hypothetical protein [Kofleriaceae bacterium]